MGICGNNIRRIKTELDCKITAQVSEFKYLRNTVSFDNKNIELKIKTYNKMNGINRQSFGKQIPRETQLRLHNTTSKEALTYGSENWILKQRNGQGLGAAQMRFLRLLTRYTRLMVT
jgi:hypothetical protein